MLIAPGQKIMYKKDPHKQRSMQKTPWFHEGQADVMLNYLPLRNVLTWGIKAMVKNKALPDSAPPVWSLSLSLADLALSRLASRVFSLSLSLSLSPMPFILRVPPGSCRGWTPAIDELWTFCKKKEVTYKITGISIIPLILNGQLS